MNGYRSKGHLKEFVGHLKEFGFFLINVKGHL